MAMRRQTALKSSSTPVETVTQPPAEPTRLFGVRLAEVMKRPSQTIIPTFVKQLIHYLTTQAITTEGLFRIAPNPKILTEMKAKIDSGEQLNLDDPNASKDLPHIGASLLKIYLRELPEPLLPFNLYHDFVNATSFSQSPGYLDHISSLINKLPTHSKALLEILLLFFAKVAQHHTQNKLTSAHLAIVFGPIILRPEVETIESANNTPKVIAVFKFMIERFEQIFMKQNSSPSLENQNTDLAFFLNPQTQPSVYFDKIEGNEDKKLAKAKETIEEAIILLQGRLEDLSRAIEETESIDAVLEIAKRVRNSKRVLFNDSNGPMVQPLIGFKCPRPLKKGANGGITRIPKPTSAFESLQGKRKTMEDTHTAIDDLNKPFPNLSKSVRRSYYGVYDGHSGRDAAILAQDHLHKNIVGDPAFMEGDFVKAILNGYRRTDKFILEVAARDQWKNGTTSVSALVINNMLYIANCGDSEAVMAKKKPHGLEAVEISAKHKPNDPKEKKRIEDLGGAVFGARVFGTLAVSRSFGDPEYKLPISQADFITAEPFIATYTLEEDVDQFFVLACDGLWDKLNYQEVVDFVARSFDNGNDVQQTAALLARESIDRGSSDNVTVIVILLQWNSYFETE